jgi:hypothetical protein
MAEALRARILRVTNGKIVPDLTTRRIQRLIALYSCRIVSARDYRKLVKYIFPDSFDLQQNLLTLKDFLDHSTTRNNIFRALYAMANSEELDDPTLLSIGLKHDIEPDDLQILYRILNERERQALASLATPPGEWTTLQVQDLMKRVDRIIKNYAKRYLRFVVKHDEAIDTIEDLAGELRTAAVKVIREYEVQNYTDDHMIKTVVRSVRNHAVNMAEAYGREKRAPVVRIKKRDPFRLAWYLNIRDNSITQVQVRPDLDARDCYNGDLRIIVRDSMHNRTMRVHLKRLYETREEALDALQRRQRGEYSKREHYIDLSPRQRDEFQTTSMSIYKKTDDDHATELIERLPDERETFAKPDESAYKELVCTAEVNAREFATLVNDPYDPFFLSFAEDMGEDPSTCDCSRLGNLVCSYLNTTKEQVRAELLNTSAELWTSAQLRILTTGVPT